MSHMVIFQTKDGNPGYNQFDEVEGAVRFVEDLRNNQGIENARIFALQEVRYQMRQVYRVELNPPTLESSTSASTPAVAAAPTAEINRDDEAPRSSWSSTPFGSAPEPVAEERPAPRQEFGSAPFGSTFSDQSAPASVPEEPVRRGLFGR